MLGSPIRPMVNVFASLLGPSVSSCSVSLGDPKVLLSNSELCRLLLSLTKFVLFFKAWNSVILGELVTIWRLTRVTWQSPGLYFFVFPGLFVPFYKLMSCFVPQSIYLKIRVFTSVFEQNSPKSVKVLYSSSPLNWIIFLFGDFYSYGLFEYVYTF